MAVSAGVGSVAVRPGSVASRAGGMVVRTGDVVTKRVCRWWAMLVTRAVVAVRYLLYILCLPYFLGKLQVDVILRHCSVDCEVVS